MKKLDRTVVQQIAQAATRSSSGEPAIRLNRWP